MSADPSDPSPDKERGAWWSEVIEIVMESRSTRTDREIGDLIVERLRQRGMAIVDEAVAPDWAQHLLDSLFTGSRLDFDGADVPSWLVARLEAEYGMPMPIGGGVAHPPGPVDLDDEEPDRLHQPADGMDNPSEIAGGQL